MTDGPKMPYGKVARRTADRPNFIELPNLWKLILFELWTSVDGANNPIVFEISLKKYATRLTSRSEIVTEKRILQVLRALAESGWIEFDEKNLLVVCLRQHKFDRPANGNVIKGWVRAANNLPESPLLATFWGRIAPFCRQFRCEALIPTVYRTVPETVSDTVQETVWQPQQPATINHKPAASSHKPERFTEPVRGSDDSSLTQTDNPDEQQSSITDSQVHESFCNAIRVLMDVHIRPELESFQRKGWTVTWSTLYSSMETWVKANPDKCVDYVRVRPEKGWALFVIRWINREHDAEMLRRRR